MIKIARTKAEQRSAAVERRQQAILTEMDEAAANLRKKSAELRALRLFRESENISE